LALKLQQLQLRLDRPLETDSEESSRALQVVKDGSYWESEVTVRVMLAASTRKPIQIWQAADACVRVVERYRSSHVVRHDLLDPLWVKFITDNENTLQVHRSKFLPGWQLLPGRGR